MAGVSAGRELLLEVSWEYSWGCIGLRVNIPRDSGKKYRFLMT